MGRLQNFTLEMMETTPQILKRELADLETKLKKVDKLPEPQRTAERDILRKAVDNIKQQLEIYEMESITVGRKF